MNITVQGDLLVNVYIHGQPYLPEQAQITSDHIGRSGANKGSYPSNVSRVFK